MPREYRKKRPACQLNFPANFPGRPDTAGLGFDDAFERAVNVRIGKGEAGLQQTAGRFTLNIHICAPRYLLELEGADEIIAALEQATAAIHAEDIAVNDLVWRGMSAPMTGQGRLSPLERSIWQMNQWWLTQMGL